MTEGGVRLMGTSTVGIQRMSGGESGDGTNRGPGIIDKGPLMVHAGTQTGGHGHGQQGNGSTVLGKTRSSLSSAAVAIHGGVTNRELREYNRRSGGSHSSGSISHSGHSGAGAGASGSGSSINPRRAAKIRHRSSASSSSAVAAPQPVAAAPPPPPPPPPLAPLAPPAPSTAAQAAAAAIIGGIPNYNHHLNHNSNHRSGVLSPISSSSTVAHAATNTGAGFAFPHPNQYHVGGRHTPGTVTPLEMDPPVLSFWGTDPVPLPSRFARIKRKLVAGHEAELSRSWAELITALQAEVRHIEELGPHLIPSVEFAEIDDPSQSTRFSRDLKRYGVGVVRGVVPKSDAESYVRETVDYLKGKKDFKPPRVQDPTCFDFFWTPAQVRTRAHPSVLRAQRFMMGLWETNADDKVATKFPITYADRIRIHGLPGYKTSPAVDPGKDEMDTTDDSGKHKHPLPAKSADDWLNAIQSSTIIAQVDNGSLERWEPDGYQRGGTYDRVFKGEWEAYDPWECGGRVSTTTDLYNGYGACSIFRMFQGLVALSTIEPGMVRILPSPKLVTAYFLLRPFFSPKMPCPESREGPEWEAYLHPDNWSLDKDQNTIIHGAVPGHAQRVTELWHPHLHLRRSLITLPTLQAGDYIFWHPDLAYHITSDGTGLRSDNGFFAPDDVRMLVYVPAAPLTQTGALYLARQRKQFLRGQPGPDFDSTGSGLVSEGVEGRLGKEDIADIGGPAALQSMGLTPYEVSTTPRSTDLTTESSSASSIVAGDIKKPAPQPAVTVSAAGKDLDMEDVEADTKSVRSTTSSSHGEAEVVRLANIILFPDQWNMGFPHKEGGNGHPMSTTTTSSRKRGASENGGGSGSAPKSQTMAKRPDIKEASMNTST